MSNCLGLYIEENLIKYAKVSKEREDIKIEAFGVKFHENINEAIEQIIEETDSHKTPISINLSEEMYNFFDMFALLTKNDLQKAIKTEFESYCEEKGYNPNVFETRYAAVNKRLDKDKIKIIHVAENKIELNKRIQQVEGYKLNNISPIAMSIPNLINIKKDKKVLVVNIENKTSITTMMGNRISGVNLLDIGSQDFLAKIKIKENSYPKAYEICKNTTIYTSEAKDLQDIETNYLEDIMPILYQILGEVKKLINIEDEKVEKVYITGTAALINNIDLYFQEYLSEVNCEIVKPHFIRQTKDLSIKDYIEVNSAISIALMGLGEGISGMNFKKATISKNVPDWLNIEIKPGKTKNKSKKIKKSADFLKFDLSEKLDVVEKGMVRVSVGLLLLIIIYSSFSALLSHQIKQKINEANESIASTRSQIQLANADNEKIKIKANDYTTMIRNLQEANDRMTDRNRARNAIPNLLNQIMSIIPGSVQLTSIENNTGTHIVINAQSNKYEQLGYLIAKMKTDVILTNVISTAGQKDNGVITVRIEGDLP